jgi:hypothetical protein
MISVKKGFETKKRSSLAKCADGEDLYLIVREVVLETDLAFVGATNAFPVSPIRFRVVAKDGDVRPVVENQRPVSDQAAHKRLARHVVVQGSLFLGAMSTLVRQERVQHGDNPAVHENARTVRVACNLCGLAAIGQNNAPDAVVGCRRGYVGEEGVGGFQQCGYVLSARHDTLNPKP